MHCKNEEVFADKNKPIVAVAWKELGDLSSLKKDREIIKKAFENQYPDKSKSSVASSAGQIYRFYAEMKVGDFVVFSGNNTKQIYIGKIVGDYYYDSEEYEYRHKRRVEWIKILPRLAFSQGALYELGAFLTVFKIKNYADEFLKAAVPGFSVSNAAEQVDATVEQTTAVIKDNTKAFVLKALRKHYKGYDLEIVVENLLKAMGYRTQRSPMGGDRGYDIIAYKDELPPRVLVQVKSQDADIPETSLQALKGTLKAGDYGLFVTLSNYSKNARDFIEQNPIIKAMNGDNLVELLLDFYDGMDVGFKNKVKLERVYLPVKETE